MKGLDVMVITKWSTYNYIVPENSGYEVNVGYMNNGVFSLENDGGVLVSKIFSPNTSNIYFVERSYVAAYIANGVYTAPSG